MNEAATVNNLLPPSKLDTITFYDDIELDGRASRLVGSTDIPLKNVYTYFRGMFQVRMYLGDTQTCIACGTATKCLRMADCALLYFWPYRIKPNRHIVETDLNLGLAAASRELAHNVVVRDHLCAVEQAMIARRSLDPSRKRKPRERVSRGELFKAWAEYKACLESVKLTVIEKKLGAYEDAIVEQIGSGQSLVNSLDRQIFNA